MLPLRPRSSPAPSVSRPVCRTVWAFLCKMARATGGWHSHAQRNGAWQRPLELSAWAETAWPASCPAAAHSGLHYTPRRSESASLCRPAHSLHPTETHKEQRRHWLDTLLNIVRIFTIGRRRIDSQMYCWALINYDFDWFWAAPFHPPNPSLLMCKVSSH